MRVKAYDGRKLVRDSQDRQGDSTMPKEPVEVAPAGDAAEYADVPTAIRLEIFLNYPGGRLVSAHRDAARTKFSIAPSGRFVLSGQGTDRLEIRGSSGSTIGKGTLSISFSHERHTMNVSFELVRHFGFQVRASPWPIYRKPNSNKVRVRKLAPIGEHGSGVEKVWEQAIGRCHMVLTNGKSPPMDPLH